MRGYGTGKRPPVAPGLALDILLGGAGVSDPENRRLRESQASSPNQVSREVREGSGFHRDIQTS